MNHKQCAPQRYPLRRKEFTANFDDKAISFMPKTRYFAAMNFQANSTSPEFYNIAFTWIFASFMYQTFNLKVFKTSLLVSLALCIYLTDHLLAKAKHSNSQEPFIHY